jgi:nicotinate phosphoribosyltransferase
VYKLVAVDREKEHRPSTKLSPGKVTFPGKKSVRRVEHDGEYAYDVLGLRDDEENEGDGEEGRELLVPVVEDGTVVVDTPDLGTVRERARRERRRLPPACRRATNPTDYEVRVDPALDRLTAALRRQLEGKG